MDIDPKKNYERRMTGEVFTGVQLNNLRQMSKEARGLIALSFALDLIVETDKPATHPGTKYGPAEA